MSPMQIREHLRAEPFRPFSVRLSNGSSYEIHHPEMALVTRTEIAIALEPATGELAERMVYCDPLHVVEIVPLESASQPAPGS